MAFHLRQDLGIPHTECIDLDVVVDKLFIKVKWAILGLGIEGACKSVGVKRLVVLNPAHKKSLKERFTLSHEIGHLLIHHNAHICRAEDFNTYRTHNDKENEANDFAAELLLPQRAVMEIIKKKDLSLKLLEDVANKYQTTLSVAAIRITQMFNDNVMLIWHDGKRTIWKVKSNTCFLKASENISPMALSNKTSDIQRIVKGNISSECWVSNCPENFICEEESCYFVNIKKYMTILKFHEED